MNPSSVGTLYKIENKIDGKFYIGSTIGDVNGRFRAHYLSLRQNKHHSVYLQRAWNKYGENAFEFSVLRKCPIDRVRKCEQFLLDKFKSYDPHIGYNMNHKVDSRYGRKMSKEARAKISLAKQGKPSPRKGVKLTEEIREKLSLSHKGQIPWIKGKTLSEESRKKISESCKGRIPWNKDRPCPEMAGENNGFYGKSHTEKTRQKMSESAKKRRANRKGMKHTEETKRRMSEGQKNRRKKERDLDAATVS